MIMLIARRFHDRSPLARLAGCIGVGGVLACVAACISIALSGCEKSGAPEQSQKSASGTPDAAKPAVVRIAVVPKGTTHDFWKTVHAGAIKAQRELGGVEVTFRGPEREDDREQQVSLVQSLVGSKYDAIVLAPLDDTALVAPVRAAAAAGVPVVVIDSALRADAGKDFVSFVSTDNRKGGSLAADEMARLLPAGGSVLLLRYAEGSASTGEREDGFVERATALKLSVIDPKRYAGVTRATAQEVAENLLAANPKIDGVYCPNESTTFGMLLAIRSRGLVGKVKFVGFDASEGLVQALDGSEIDALVVQNPMRMGYLGVTSAVRHLRGEIVDHRLDTGVTVVTRANKELPEVRELLHPDLASYLGNP